MSNAGWQDISTAPKDGTWILSFSPDAVEPGIFVVQWVTWEEEGGQFGEWSESVNLNLDVDLTHWMSLPERPAS